MRCLAVNLLATPWLWAARTLLHGFSFKIPWCHSMPMCSRELLSGNLSMHCAHPWQRQQEKAMWGKGEVGKCPNAGDKCLIAGVAVLQCRFFCRG